MRRLLFVLLCVVATLPPAAAGNAPAHVNGGGRGTIDDGETAFSQFGFEVSKSTDGSVRGHFNCLMAGSSRFPGFTLMAVRGEVTSLSVSGDSATFAGSGMLQTGNLGKSQATFSVVVTKGGPGVGTLQLTMLAPSLSSSAIALPTEKVLTGSIAVG